MKKLAMLLMGSIGCLMISDINAMIVVKKMKIAPKIRWCCQDYRVRRSPDIFECIRRVQIGNDYLIDWHQGRVEELERKKLAIIKKSLPLDVEDYHFHSDVYSATCDLRENDWEIYKHMKLITRLEKENRDLEEKYKLWERA